MGAASRYWIFVRIDSFGNCQRQELEENQTFFSEQFPEFVGSLDIPDRDIQRQLMQWFQGDDTHRQMAESCLRCFISNRIREICLVLEQKFGREHGFTSAHLLPLVLDGNRRSRLTNGNQTNERSLTTQILQSFDPYKGNLSTWTSRMFKSDKLVKQLLLVQGIEQVTDWLILNYTTVGRLERVLSDDNRTSTEIKLAIQLLDCYHQVYRQQLGENRKAGSKIKFPDPTEEQLRQIAEHWCQDIAGVSKMTPEKVLQELQDLASLLRKERIRARRGLLPLEPLDNGITTINYQDEQNENYVRSQVLVKYGLHFDKCLAQSVKQVIESRLKYLQSKKNKKSQNRAENFCKALRLFHCQGVPMKEIAHQLGFVDQPHLSHLLKLTQLREDIKRNTLECLQKCVPELAESYADPDLLRNSESEVESILSEEIKGLVEEAEKEALRGHNRIMNSKLSLIICQNNSELRI